MLLLQLSLSGNEKNKYPRKPDPAKKENKYSKRRV